MAHYDIPAIRSALADPAEVCRALRLQTYTRQRENGFFVQCPAHAERTASCSVTRGRDRLLRVKCFGCPLSGDVFDLIAAAEHLDRNRDFQQVLARAAELAKAHPAEPVKPRAEREPRPSLPDADFDRLVKPILHVGRLDDPALYEFSAIAGDVSAYLERRELLSDARAHGWAALPADQRSQRAWIRMLLATHGEDALRHSGLFQREERGFLFPENRLVIPWRSPDGLVTTLQRRRLDDQRANKYVFCSGRAPRWPYGVERLRTAHLRTPAVLAEGAVDVLALEALASRSGDPLVPLGLPGVESWGARRGAWSQLFRGRVAIVALDADRAGEDAVDRIARDLACADAVRVERWKPSEGKDWAEIWRSIAAATTMQAMA